MGSLPYTRDAYYNIYVIFPSLPYGLAHGKDTTPSHLQQGYHTVHTHSINHPDNNSGH